MKRRVSNIAAWIFLLSAIGAEPVQTVADVREVIRQGLREGKMEIDTPAGRYVHPPCNHDMKRDEAEDPVLGPSITELNVESRKFIRTWISVKQPQWVAIVVPADSSARDFIGVCSLLRELDIGYTIFLSTDVEGRKFNRLTLIRGNFDELRFTKKAIRLPLQRPIAPKADGDKPSK